MKSRKATARAAGVLYLILAVTGGFSMLYAPSLIVPGDAAATANRILSSEPLFRIGIVSGLICQVVFVFLALALYKLLNGVNKMLASVMVALVVAAVPVAFLNMLNQLAALHLVGGADHLRALDAEQLKALMMLFLDLHGYGLLIVEIFWGLWLFPLGLLVIKSRFIPWIVGILLIVACFGYVIDFLTRLLLPGYTALVSPIAGVSKVGELSIILWLLIVGVRTTRSDRGEVSAPA